MKLNTEPRCIQLNILIKIGIPVSILLLFTLAAWFFDADLQIARLIYVKNEQWPGVNNLPWTFLYDYAAYPAFLMAGVSFVVLVLGFFIHSIKRYRGQAVFLILLLALGPGLVVNVLFKDNLGRARPHEIKEFGGKYEFSQVWQAGETGRNSSFPSGHASAAFYLIAPWFLLRRKNLPLAITWLIGGLAFGFLIGTARIMQGGHFLTDVVWAGGFVYLTGEILAILLKPDQFQASE